MLNHSVQNLNILTVIHYLLIPLLLKRIVLQCIIARNRPKQIAPIIIDVVSLMRSQPKTNDVKMQTPFDLINHFVENQQDKVVKYNESKETQESGKMTLLTLMIMRSTLIQFFFLQLMFAILVHWLYDKAMN